MCFQQEQVHTAFPETARAFKIGRVELFECGGAITGIFDLWRQGKGSIGGAHAAGDQSWGAIGRLPLIGDFSSDLCTREIDLRDEMRQSKVSLGRCVPGDAVGLDDVCAGSEILNVEVANQLRLTEVKNVHVASEVMLAFGEALAAKVRLRKPLRLHERAEGAIKNDDAFVQRGV